MSGGRGRSTITVERVETDSNTLIGEITYTPDLQRFFSGEKFRAEYSTDISDVPKSILTIPVLAHICPVAWTQKANVEVPALDSQFQTALEDVEHTLHKLYPHLIRGSDIYHADLNEEEPEPEFDGTGLLFSGGVDSIASYIRHRDENPALISVQGWTIADEENEKWQQFIDEFANKRDLDNYFIRSNMLTFLHHDMLRAYCQPHVPAASGSWYTSIGHGIGMTGLSAPLAYAKGIGDLYMSATHWNRIQFEWGSHPNIDENVRWTGTQCHHDVYELTRQERIEMIVEYAREADPQLEIRTCNVSSAYNCSQCEKCYRTALQLLIAGRDPSDHGFQFDSDSFDDIRTQLEAGNWMLGRSEQMMWENVQESVPEDTEYPYEGAEEFFRWFRGVDFTEFVDRVPLPLRERIQYAVYRNVPYPVFNAFYDTPLYHYVRHGSFTPDTSVDN